MDTYTITARSYINRSGSPYYEVVFPSGLSFDEPTQLVISNLEHSPQYIGYYISGATSDLSQLYLVGDARLNVSGMAGTHHAAASGNPLWAQSFEESTLIGGDADDELKYGAALYGGGGDDALRLGDRMYGGAGDDLLVKFYDVAYGGPGDDLFVIHPDQAWSAVDGGAGEDTFEINSSDPPVLGTMAGIEHLDVARDVILSRPVDGSGVFDLSDLFNGAVVARAPGETAFSRLQLGLEDAPSGWTSSGMLPSGYLDEGALLMLSGGDDVFRGGLAEPPGGWPDDRPNLRVDGGDGDDELHALGSHLELEGDVGDDSLFGYAADDLMYGGSDDDALSGGGGADALYGGDGEDVVAGDGGADRILGERGDDLLRGGDGADRLFGGEGTDDLRGGDGKDVLKGGEGADLLNGAGARDRLAGGQDDDRLFGGAKRDMLFGDDGDDLLKGGNAGDELEGGGGGDRLFGEARRDMLSGGLGDDVLDGGAGADEMRGDGGADLLRGGGGGDHLAGGDGDDRLYGAGGHDLLFGNDGDDRLVGGNRADTLVGALGEDSLTGGSGRDLFDFSLGDGIDIVSDFTPGKDRLRFEGGAAEFSQLDISARGDFVFIGWGYIDDVVTLEGVQASDLKASDFLFV